jgi:Transposase
MEVIVERPAALDVHNASVMACVRVPGDGRRRVEHVAEFQTTVQGLLALRDWLEAHEVDQVAMEATGVYWKPVWAVLEDRFACLLVNARHVKQVPGRKTDVMDAQWLCQLLEAGLLRASLVPPKPIRTLRNLTRYRKSQIRDRQREMNRLHKVMQDTGIKLDTVATDMLGKSGRAMLDALVSGTTDPGVLADLARGRLRKKLPALRAALQGRFDAEHVLVVGRILAHIDYLDEAIDDLSRAIEEQLGPFAPAVELLCTIPRRRAPCRRGDHRRDRRRHERLPDGQAPRVLGRHVPRQRRVRRQTTNRQDAQGLQMAQPNAGRVRQERQPQQEHLPRRPIRAATRPPRPQQGHHRRLPLDPHRGLAHAQHRRDLYRSRRRLLRPP